MSRPPPDECSAERAGRSPRQRRRQQRPGRAGRSAACGRWPWASASGQRRRSRADYAVEAARRTSRQRRVTRPPGRRRVAELERAAGRGARRAAPSEGARRAATGGGRAGPPAGAAAARPPISRRPGYAVPAADARRPRALCAARPCQPRRATWRRTRSRCAPTRTCPNCPRRVAAATPGAGRGRRLRWRPPSPPPRSHAEDGRMCGGMARPGRGAALRGPRRRAPPRAAVLRLAEERRRWPGPYEVAEPAAG